MRTAVVAVKHVPVGGAFLRIADGRLTRDGVAHGIDPAGEVGLEWAIRAREAGGLDRVVAVTMGPPGAADTLRQAVALGADEALHVCDDRLVGADVRTTARVLAATTARMEATLLVAGYESLDASSGAVPAAAAALLGWPLVSRMSDATLTGSGLRADRDLGGGNESVDVDLPVVVSMVEGRVSPRYPKLKHVLRAKSFPLRVLTAADLDVTPARGGETAAGLIAVPARDKETRVLDFDEGVAELLAVLTGDRAHA
jgi:electron transfer flavoprotein beta subunit